MSVKFSVWWAFWPCILMHLICANHSFGNPGEVNKRDETQKEENERQSLRNARVLTGPILDKTMRTIEIKTSLGVVLGTIDASESHTQDPLDTGRVFYSFRGIPYAKAPVGQQRWSDPVDETRPWSSGRIDATRFRSICPQWDRGKQALIGSEDCLFLNIFTPFLPDSSSSEGLPVLVFIHGGAYIRGNSDEHGPQRIMRENLLVVTLNYRLGVLGFLSTEDSTMAGNYGVLDQVSALRWVQRNIGDFGGDPKQVTLGGFSSGASFVHLHMLSPLSKGLFHKAIMMSGAGNCLWSVQEEPWEVAKQLATDLDCPRSSSYALKQCLLLKDTEELIRAQTNRQRFIYWPFLYRPVVDVGMREDAFLPAPVWELESKPLPSTVPVLIGATAEEGILFALRILLVSEESSHPSRVFDEASRYIFESLLPNKTTSQEISEMLASFYFSKGAKEDMSTFISEMTEATSDLLFMSCIWKATENLLEKGSTVYSYLMTHHEPTSPSFNTPAYEHFAAAGVSSPLFSHGVSHGDDVVLIFSFPYVLMGLNSRDHVMSQMLTRFWANFIRTGSPHSQQLSSQGAPTWEPLVLGKPLFYYSLSLSPSIVDRPFKYKEHNLWTQTLPMIEAMAIEATSSYMWQVATWVLLTLVILLVILLVAIGVLIYQKKKKQSYSGGLPSLRGDVPRMTSVRET